MSPMTPFKIKFSSKSMIVFHLLRVFDIARVFNVG